MSKRMLAIGVLWLWLSSGACVAASDAEASKPLSFEQALQRAVANSPELRKYAISIDIAEQEVVRARSAFLPHVDVSSVTQQIEAFGGIPGLESLLLSGRRRVYNASSELTVGLNLFNGGADVAGLRATGERREEAQLQLEIQKVALASLVLERYHAVRQAEIELGIATVRHESWIGQIEQTRKAFELGRKSALAVSEAEYEGQSAELTRAGKLRAYTNARRDLIETMGPEHTETFAQAPSAIRPPYDVVLRKLGLDVSAMATDVDTSTSRVRQAQIDITRARNRYFPRVDAFVKTSYGGVSEAGFGTAFQEQGRDKRRFGVTMTWNLFDGFDTSAEVRAAALKASAAHADRDLAVQEKTRRVNEVSRLLTDMIEEEEIERRRLALMQKQAEINQAKLELGRTDAASIKIDERDIKVQKLELEKREEAIAYYKAKLLLREGRQ